VIATLAIALAFTFDAQTTTIVVVVIGIVVLVGLIIALKAGGVFKTTVKAGD
jgi:hypothetical protein